VYAVVASRDLSSARVSLSILSKVTEVSSLGTVLLCAQYPLSSG
jgi:hypothetical protein